MCQLEGFVTRPSGRACPGSWGAVAPRVVTNASLYAPIARGTRLAFFDLWHRAHRQARPRRGKVHRVDKGGTSDESIQTNPPPLGPFQGVGRRVREGGGARQGQPRR